MARTRWPPGPVNPGLLHRTGRSDRQRRWVPKNLGPGRQVVSQDSPDSVSRTGSQAGTQAPDPTPVPSQNRGSRAGGPEALSTVSLPNILLSGAPIPVPRLRVQIIHSSIRLAGGLRGQSSRHAIRLVMCWLT
jgi:hypothetical protein